MKVLFDIVHPADVLFFKRPIATLTERGDEVLVLSRHKDVACDLLDEFGIPHRAISSAGSGSLFALGSELIRRDFAVFRAARRFRPDVMIGFGGLAISHVGRLLSIPSISFYDSENARLQTKLTWPFITRLYVPAAYSGPVPAGRVQYLGGVKELSYLHPSAFRADRDVAISNGLDPDRDNFLVRVVAWRAGHDIGKRGWSGDVLGRVVEWSSRRGEVHISSETPLPVEFEPFRYRGRLSEMHHLIAHCRLLIGESATMASEAAVLGVPAIYAGKDFPGYTRSLEAAGLLANVSEVAADSILNAAERILVHPARHFTELRDDYVAGCPDWANAVVAALDSCEVR